MTWICQCGRYLHERDGLLVCTSHGVRTQADDLAEVSLKPDGRRTL